MWVEEIVECIHEVSEVGGCNPAFMGELADPIEYLGGGIAVVEIDPVSTRALFFVYQAQDSFLEAKLLLYLSTKLLNFLRLIGVKIFPIMLFLYCIANS